MLASLTLSLMLHAAPLSFEQGEFLGWTADGTRYAWTSSLQNKAVNQQQKTVQWRDINAATQGAYVIEADGKPGPDVASAEEWKKSNPLTKPTSFEGLKTTVKVDGKPATSFGGTGKAVKLELLAELGKKKASGKSIFVEYLGKKIRKATVAAFPSPTGQHVLFVLQFEAGGGEPATGEFVEVSLSDAK